MARAGFCGKRNPLMGGITVSKLAERIGMDALRFLHSHRGWASAAVHNPRQAIPQPLRGSSLCTREPFLAETPNRPPNSKRRLSAQARGSLQLPRNTQPIPSKEQGRCPRGEHLLGALWFFLAARKNNNKLRATEIMPPTAIYNLVMMQPSSHRPSHSP